MRKLVRLNLAEAINRPMLRMHHVRFLREYRAGQGAVIRCRDRGNKTVSESTHMRSVSRGVEFGEGSGSKGVARVIHNHHSLYGTSLVKVVTSDGCTVGINSSRNFLRRSPFVGRL